MKVEELAPGFWRWSAGERWCVYYEAPGATILIDPIVPDERERFFRALDRDIERRALPVVILCTDAESAEAASELGERYGATVIRA